MGYRLRELEAEDKFSQALTLEVLSQIVPTSTIQAVVQQEAVAEKRERKLTMLVTVWLIISMNLYSRLSLGHVMQKLGQGLRFIWHDPDYQLPGDSAISYRRYQLGARPVVALFHLTCRPMTGPQTVGAFLFGLRLMAIDGTVEDVPDTAANVAAFGRHHSDRGASAFPQVCGVYLVECGAHAIVDAGFWPCHTSERLGGFRLLRSVGPGMLLMWDRGFHDYEMIRAVQQRGAHVLGRLPAQVKPRFVRPLPDGSYLAYLYPADYQRRKRGEHLLLRIIEYSLTDPALPGYAETHRLVTTLLAAEACPGLELACAYHERWEIELVIDEIDSHQRLVGHPLRSLKPVGVIQELYGLLIAHYAIRGLMHQAALQADLDPDRLSFVHTLQLLHSAIPEFQLAATEQLPQLYARLLRDIAAKRLPVRRLRSNPRVVKRKMSKFLLKRPEHDHRPQPSRSLRQAVALRGDALPTASLLVIQPPVFTSAVTLEQVLI